MPNAPTSPTPTPAPAPAPVGSPLGETGTTLGPLECEYVVVGSGAGGGTLAARLAEAGRAVILLEAGGDPRRLCGHNLTRADVSLPEDYDVPAFHPLASENDALKWDFFVRHSEQVGGVLYPR